VCFEELQLKRRPCSIWSLWLVGFYYLERHKIKSMKIPKCNSVTSGFWTKSLLFASLIMFQGLWLSFCFISSANEKEVYRHRILTFQIILILSTHKLHLYEVAIKVYDLFCGPIIWWPNICIPTSQCLLLSFSHHILDSRYMCHLSSYSHKWLTYLHNFSYLCSFLFCHFAFRNISWFFCFYFSLF
jgi:hypothetical protein